MLSTHIDLTVPTVKTIQLDSLEKNLNDLGKEALSIIELGFHGDYGGSASLVFPHDSAEKLVSAVTGEEVASSNLSSMHIETLNEIGNIILNGVMGSFSNIMFSELKYTLPNYSELIPDELSKKLQDRKNVIILFINTKFSADDLNIDGHILLLFEISSFKDLTKAIDSLLA